MDGDNNTKFFYVVINHCLNALVHTLKPIKGITLAMPKEIHMKFVKHL